LLGRTFIASDLPTATAQIQNGHAGCDFVTLTGDLLSRHGIYTGGYLNGHGNPKAPGSILGRKNQITELQNELTEMQNRVAEMSRKRGALLSEQTELQASLQQAQTELREQEVAIATREGEFNALQNSNRLLHQKIETVFLKSKASPRRSRKACRNASALTAQLNELEARERAGQEQVPRSRPNWKILRQQRDAANAALTESKVALAAEEQLGASFRQQQQALEQRIRELTQVSSSARRMFLVCRAQGAGGIGNSGFARPD
jgi:chromosome segregation protein